MILIGGIRENRKKELVNLMSRYGCLIKSKQESGESTEKALSHGQEAI